MPHKPNITLIADEHERLSALAHAAMHHDPDTAEMLNEELERARVITRGCAPRNIVCMHSEVLYRDDTTKEIRQISLVFPGEADIARNKVSVLTPIGSALIGLRAGQSISWRTRRGDLKRLTVLKVTEPRAHKSEPRSYEAASLSI